MFSLSLYHQSSLSLYHLIVSSSIFSKLVYLGAQPSSLWILLQSIAYLLSWPGLSFTYSISTSKASAINWATSLLVLSPFDPIKYVSPKFPLSIIASIPEQWSLIWIQSLTSSPVPYTLIESPKIALVICLGINFSTDWPVQPYEP